jgi:hypothetical protein
MWTFLTWCLNFLISTVGRRTALTLSYPGSGRLWRLVGIPISLSVTHTSVSLRLAQHDHSGSPWRAGEAEGASPRCCVLLSPPVSMAFSQSSRMDCLCDCIQTLGFPKGHREHCLLNKYQSRGRRGAQRLRVLEHGSPRSNLASATIC